MANFIHTCPQPTKTTAGLGSAGSGGSGGGATTLVVGSRRKSKFGRRK